MAQVIQLRRDTLANWTLNNPTPAQGEACYESDTGKLKIGDGINAYLILPYFSGTAGLGDMTKAVYDPAGINQQLMGLTAVQTGTNKTFTNVVLDGTVTGSGVLDEDNMASNSATKVCTQQSIKAYVDNSIVGLSVPGLNTQVAFNDAGAWGADAGMTYNKATDTLTLVGGLITPLISSSGTIDVKPSGDNDDYLQFKTVGNVPEITTAGACNLKITASSGTIDFDDENLQTTGNLNVGGKLTVGGLIDPTGLILTPQAAAPSVSNGTIYYNSGTNKFNFRENGAWVTIPAAGGGGDMTKAVYDPANISEQLLGLTATQSVSNKSFVDDNTFFVDNLDATKRMKFQCSGISAGATRTLTIPDVSDTLTLVGATQTLTGKTLTSATYNGTMIGTAIKDEDNMASNSDQHTATQQSIKAYVDTAGKGTLQQVFNNGQSITIADGTNLRLDITNNDVTNNPHTVYIDNNGTRSGLYINQAGNETTGLGALFVASSIGGATQTGSPLGHFYSEIAASTADVVKITNYTKGIGINIEQIGVLDVAKYGLYVYSNAAQINSAALVRYVLDNASSTAAVLRLDQDGTGYGLISVKAGGGPSPNIYVLTSENSAQRSVGIDISITNAGAGVEYAFQFSGDEHDAAAHGNTAAGRVKVYDGGVTKYIYMYSD
jgi:hypothetical protein